MKRRQFLTTAAAAGLTGALTASSGPAVPKTSFTPSSIDRLPDSISGMSLTELREDYRARLFDGYIPFWDKGGFDAENGGFMCELYDDGTVQNDEKFIWYQGRAVWVYAYLYNNFGRDPRYLEIAEKTRDFMEKFMYSGNGMWLESVDRNGKKVASTGQGSGSDIYGAMFASAGLIELYKAAGNEQDLELAKNSIWTSMKRYNDPGYDGVGISGSDATGLRSQGHSFMTVWPLTQLLSFHDDSALEALQREHVGHIVNDFWNPDYGIVNETLFHDYSRIPGHEATMAPGHSLETLWMVMYDAIRIKDRALFDTCKNRIRRLIEMNWDYVYEGWGTNSFRVFASEKVSRGPSFDVKNMWAHTEILVACMTVLEYTGEVWAKEWYERAREYSIRTMANTGHGVWRQAVDRYG
ncbi:AGE family epimerase/isomerase, partial [Candidatus Latescibacterota bacterium]